MPGARLQLILDELSARGDGRPSSARLCEMSVEIVGVTGCGVMLMSGDVARGSLCATDEVSHLIEDLQFSLGEGPCVESYRENHVVLEPDLAEPATRRWLAFAAPALQAGARAVFAFPLRVGSVRLGALNLYRDQPGPLSDDQLGDALVMADATAQWVLDMQADAPPGTVSQTLDAGADFHFAVHNAAGMVSVQLGVSITEALVRLRAAAFSSGRSLDDLSQDVIARRVRFD
jgi:GAF domain-containing protein